MKLLLFKPIMIVVLLVTAFNHCYAGGEKRLTGARSSAMAGTSVTNCDVWSAFNNQAALSSLKKPCIGIYYENRFSLKQLSYKAAVYAYPSKYGTFAINASQFGFSLWNETKAGLAYAKSFGKYVSFGTQLDYILINKGEPYGRFNMLTFEAGLIASLSPKFVIGAHIYNPLSFRISKLSDERVPSSINVGLAYNVSKQFLITGEAEKSIDEKLNLKAGLEFHLLDAIAIRTGISTYPALFSFGVGIQLRKFMVDVSTTRHQTLGFSPQTSVAYALD